MPNCIICLEYSMNNVKCARKCNYIVCSDCISRYFELCDSEPKLPTCINPACGVMYIHTDLDKKISEPVLFKYYSAIFKYLVKEKNPILAKKSQKLDMITKVRNERNIYLKTKFPASIAAVADIAFKNQLSRVQKDRMAAFNSALAESHLQCFNLMCDGSLDKDYKCLKCESHFCNKCEQIKKPDHVCNDLDVSTIELARQGVEYPNCKVRIHRSSGCNHMTCTRCQTNFDYSTGQRGAIGGPPQAAHLTTSTHTLITVYGHLLSDTFIYNAILKFQAQEPKEKTDKSIENALFKLAQEQIEPTNTIIKKIAIQYNNYMISRYDKIRYISQANQLEEQLKKGSITREMVAAILK
jgi:hypothetical protein